MIRLPPARDADSRPVRVRLEYLDGIRGLAALFIVFHHLWRTQTGVALPGLKGLLTNWLLYGHLSVDVFIVLSGTCLMLPVARSRSLRGGWRQFYLRRAWRILPPFYAAIALALLLNFIFQAAQPSARAVLANLLLLQDVLPGTNTLDGVLWSVALEWKIYFLFPLFVWLWLRFGSSVVLVTSAAVGYGLMGLLGAVSPSLSLTHTCPWYVFLFGMGMAATDFVSRPQPEGSRRLLPVFFAAALAVLMLLLLKWPITAAGEDAIYGPHLPIIDAAAGVVTALALILLGQKAALQEHSLPIKLLSWKPLVFVGTIGYSLYLIHTMVIYRMKHLLIDRLHIHPFLIVTLLDVALTIGIAYGFHLVFERPFMSKPGGLTPKTEHQAEIAAIVSPAP